MGVTIRTARWPADERGIGALEYSYTTDRVYRVRRDGLSFQLGEERLAAPRYRAYPPLAGELSRLRAMQHVVVAEGEDGGVLGLAAARVEAWNRRARVEEMVVAPAARGRGIGRALMDSVVRFGRRQGCWCVWLETQADNYGAVEFYRRLGFRLCGLDECLYDPASLQGDALALFFALEVGPDGERDEDDVLGAAVLRAGEEDDVLGASALRATGPSA